MSAHSMIPGRVRHVTNPRPPWTAEYRHARRSYLLWRASSAVEAVVLVVCCVALLAMVVGVPVLLIGGAR